MITVRCPKCGAEQHMSNGNRPVFVARLVRGTGCKGVQNASANTGKQHQQDGYRLAQRVNYERV